MLELDCAIPTPSTQQELEKTIQFYRASDLSDTELYCYWQAIRDAAMEQKLVEPQSDRVPGSDSY